MRAASMSRAAGALLLGALLAAAESRGCAPDPPPPPACQDLRSRGPIKYEQLGVQCVSLQGAPVVVTLYWGSGPARAAAALLRVLLRDVLRYSRVRLAQAPHTTQQFALNMTHDPSASYTNTRSAAVVSGRFVACQQLLLSKKIAVRTQNIGRTYLDTRRILYLRTTHSQGVSTAWKPEAPPDWQPYNGKQGGLAGPRLSEFGSSAVPARCGLHAWRPPARALACADHTRWSFYKDAHALAACGFNATRKENVTALEVLVVSECNETVAPGELLRRAPSLRLRVVSRHYLMHKMRTANYYSFLFIEYELWSRGDTSLSVSAVEPPPCKSFDSACHLELDPAIAMRVADVEQLRAFAPQLFYLVHNYTLSLSSLRTILEQETNETSIEEAACKWTLDNMSDTKIVELIDTYDKTSYSVKTYLCKDDPDILLYLDVLKILGPFINEETKELRYKVQLPHRYINCSDAYHMNLRLANSTKYASIYTLLGVVSQTVEGAGAASGVASASHVPMLLVDVAPHHLAANATWRVAGVPRHVALALQNFVIASGWTRLAVLSQRTTIANDYDAALRDNPNFALGEYTIPLEITELQRNTEDTLQKLRDANARIVFVNADSRAAQIILVAAHKHGMSYTDGFVWIVRDWRANDAAASTHTTHFTVSLWSRGKEDNPNPASRAGRIRAEFNKLWPNRTWPSHAASFADALLTLTDGYKNVFRQNPETRYDLRSGHAMRALNENLIKFPVEGLNQVLQYKELSVENRIVYVDEWRYGKLGRRLASWRVSTASGNVTGLAGAGAPATYSRPADLPRGDGASGCLVHVGDDFYPSCYDSAWICALVVLVLTPTALLLAHRRFKRREQKRELDRIARRRHVASVLASWLVERDALELQNELGAGRFGSVRLAVLRAPGRAPRYIAAKALRDNAAPTEESEFLREACTIASLNHAHIVRLVGVCIRDGPPLVLMELAFFGDLLEYLRARHHLAEGAVSEELTTREEAAHVSAEALTRLAREAAEALDYLSSRGVVHRDVRAANCLVDARRSLKLADFGMARETLASADGAAEYACRRRGLFPVLWMAPESLEHGVFSAASDVWALGVLVLELVTLGARPYGNMSPLRVLEYVAAGGCPPLPLDATPQTRGLTRLCWQRTAERRPSAGEVVAYLAAQPRALCPALLSGHAEPADADSGFGESPSTEQLPRYSPLHSFDKFDDLTATHCHSNK